MKLEDIQIVAVLGAGTMGHGIAEVTLMAGYKVYLQDIKKEVVDRGVNLINESLSKFVSKGSVRTEQHEKIMNELLEPCVDLRHAVRDADLVIEAIPEIMALKKETFRKVDEIAPPHAILASSTSSLRITQIASATQRPKKFLGLHYFSPVVINNLVEVIRGEQTSEETLQLATAFCESTGRILLRVEKDVPGFIVNRILQFPTSVMLGCILDEGTIQPEEVDAMMLKSGASWGPYESMDWAGVDIHYLALKYLSEELHPDYAPSPFIEEKFKSGEIGRRSGKGFFDWSRGRPRIDLSKATDKLKPIDFLAVKINEATKLLEEGVCTSEDIDKGTIHGMAYTVGLMTMAKELDSSELIQSLERLSDRFNKEIFRPTQMIRNGTYR